MPANPSQPVTVAVAFSGGRDSLALLHVTCREAAQAGITVVALHVHHGLLPEADAWVQQCQRRCADWRRKGWPVRLVWRRLFGAPAKGQSVEAWARAGRYQALAAMAREAGADLILLAQHRRDQAETVLLQALRGAGPAGLSGMPGVIERDGLTWARPWLGCGREAIEAYVARHRLKPIEDPSNASTRYARNRLREAVLPALSQAFADAETGLSQVAQRAQEAASALAELAQVDLADKVDGQGRLAWAAWRGLSKARQANALRAWWRQQTGLGPPQAFVDRILAESPGPAARWPVTGQWLCEHYRGWLQALPVQAVAEPPASLVLDLSRVGIWPVAGWAGSFEVREVQAGGLPASLLRRARLTARQGGEQFQLAPKSLPRGLKKQFQAQGVPISARVGPLVWEGECLLWVPGLGPDARALAASLQPQRQLLWCPDQSLSGQIKRTG